MSNMNPNNGNETNSDIFPWHIFKSDTTIFIRKIKSFNDFKNQNFSVLRRQ